MDDNLFVTRNHKEEYGKSEFFRSLPNGEQITANRVLERILAENVTEKMIEDAIVKRQQAAKALIDAVEAKEDERPGRMMLI